MTPKVPTPRIQRYSLMPAPMHATTDDDGRWCQSLDVQKLETELAEARELLSEFATHCEQKPDVWSRAVKFLSRDGK